MKVVRDHYGPGKPLPLANDGDLSLTFIGAGGAFSKKFYQNNILLVKGESHVLVDCGSRTPEALGRLGLSVTDVENYLITHSHADHIGGLEEVMLGNRYGPGKKPKLVATERLGRILWTMSLRGGSAYNEVHDGKSLELADFWDFIVPSHVPGGGRELCEVEVGDLNLRLFRTMHIPDSAPDWRSSFLSYGLIIDKRILFTSDTRYDPRMVAELEAEYGFEAVFHDCQLFTGGVHASLDELSGLSEAVRAKTRLMHYGDAVESYADRIRKLGFAGIAEQGASYVFPRRG
ncbi:MAG TPA: MBL fold metallo-hydrolase [Rectinemataceae bacterium]|nr:MBL fold metallo-hydrolase [Rectinemataceae bacterium]